jgi:hypothetical protein
MYDDTSATPYIQSMFGDAKYTPVEFAAHFSESLVYLRPFYTQWLDSSFAHAAHEVLTLPEYEDNITRNELRASVGLPPDVHVVCSFNSAMKFQPATFAAWMRILKVLKTAVLWLPLYPEPTTADQVRRRALEHGVAPNVLFFFDFFPKRIHLRVKAVCDLCLDSLEFHGERTTIDALWAGIPVLTVPSVRPFTRWSMSPLADLQLDRYLIARNLDDYVALAVQLLQSTRTYKLVRRRLWRNRLLGCAFDVSRKMEELEPMLRMMWDAFAADPRSATVGGPWPHFARRQRPAAPRTLPEVKQLVFHFAQDAGWGRELHHLFSDYEFVADKTEAFSLFGDSVDPEKRFKRERAVSDAAKAGRAIRGGFRDNSRMQSLHHMAAPTPQN